MYTPTTTRNHNGTGEKGAGRKHNLYAPPLHLSPLWEKREVSEISFFSSESHASELAQNQVKEYVNSLIYKKEV